MPIRRDRIVPRMNSETAAQLVTHLTHPNGWWRDTAQRLLVLKNDKSVVPSLQVIAKTSPNFYGRIHALWTLEGMGSLDAALVRPLMKDPEPRMRIQAIRASETLYKAGDLSFAADYRTATKDTSVDVVTQSMLTLSRWKVPEAATTIQATMSANKARGVQLVGTTMLNAAANAGRGGGRGGVGVDAGTAERDDEGRGDLQRAVHELPWPRRHRHADRGAATRMKAPPLAGSPRVNDHRDYIVKALLFGVTGPVDGKTYSDVMIPMGTNDDEWIASVASYVRRSFGNNGGFVTPADVARARAATAGRTAQWTADELRSTLPQAAGERRMEGDRQP